MLKKILPLTTLLISSTIFAQPVAVNKESCNKLIGSEKPFIRNWIWAYCGYEITKSRVGKV